MKEEGGNKVAFNETFSFNSQDNDLKVYVMEDDALIDDNLGIGQLNVAQYRQQPYPQDGIYNLIQLKFFAPEINNLLVKCF